MHFIHVRWLHGLLWLLYVCKFMQQMTELATLINEYQLYNNVLNILSLSLSQVWIELVESFYPILKTDRIMNLLLRKKYGVTAIWNISSMMLATTMY